MADQLRAGSAAGRIPAAARQAVIGVPAGSATL
jgi:hypothetical protein